MRERIKTRYKLRGMVSSLGQSLIHGLFMGKGFKSRRMGVHRWADRIRIDIVLSK